MNRKNQDSVFDFYFKRFWFFLTDFCTRSENFVKFKNVIL